MASQPSSSQLPSSSSHRLPTVSASQALHNIRTKASRAVSTGLPDLDKLLYPYGLPSRTEQGRSGSESGSNGEAGGGGLARGKVTEVYGPPGVGKTAFGIQAAVNALCDGNKVCWIDAAAPLVPGRFNDVLVAALSQAQQQQQQQQRPPPPSSTTTRAGLSLSQNVQDSSPPERGLDEVQSHLHHFSCPTLAHLLALFVHGPSSFPPPNTSLIVIDSLSTLFDNAYPRHADDRRARLLAKSSNKKTSSGTTGSTNSTSDQQHGRWVAGRKFTVMNELVSRLGRIASLHDIAILVSCQTITRILEGSRAVLVPAISGAEWDSGISNRLVLFRDWFPAQGKWNDFDSNRLQRARFAGVAKVNGVKQADDGAVRNVVPFTIEGTGLHPLQMDALDIAGPVPQAQQKAPEERPPKRRFTEIADSDEDEADSDELYGWAEEDEAAAEGLLVDELTATTTAAAATAGAVDEGEGGLHSEPPDSPPPAKGASPATDDDLVGA